MRNAGIKQLLITYSLVLVHMAVFFVSAGGFTARAWLFFGAAFVHYSLSTAVQYKLNPDLLVQRLKRRREGSKLWDEILMRANNLVALIGMPAVAGLDVGRFHLSDIHASLVVIGLGSFTFSTILLNWAMIVNPHFEPTVRIQMDRDHSVIAGGPYKIIRHPGYMAGILYAVSFPLIIGSLYTFIPAGIYILLTLIRTLLEDRTLQKELNGYSEYTKRTRHRLLPGVW